MRPKLNMSGDPQNDTDWDDMTEEEFTEALDSYDAQYEDAMEAQNRRERE